MLCQSISSFFQARCVSCQIDNRTCRHAAFGRRFGTTLYLVCAVLAVACSWPAYFYRGAYTWLLFLIFLAFELVTWHDLRRLSGSDLNRVLGLTARNIWIYTLLLVSLLVF